MNVTGVQSSTYTEVASLNNRIDPIWSYSLKIEVGDHVSEIGEEQRMANLVSMRHPGRSLCTLYIEDIWGLL
jgi:hypothetical protein